MEEVFLFGSKSENRDRAVEAVDIGESILAAAEARACQGVWVRAAVKRGLRIRV